MTFAVPKSISNISKAENVGLLYADRNAVSEDSTVMQKEYERVFEHYLRPFSRRQDNPIIRFITLKTKWEKETEHLSSITQIAMHPAYQQIIGMGFIAIPLILSELKNKPGHWFWALKSITGEDPVQPKERGKIKQMTEAWLRWGKERGYI